MFWDVILYSQRETVTSISVKHIVSICRVVKMCYLHIFKDFTAQYLTSS